MYRLRRQLHVRPVLLLRQRHRSRWCARTRVRILPRVHDRRCASLPRADHPCDAIHPLTGLDPCNGRGKCRCGYNAMAVCECEPQFSGESCEYCAPSYDHTNYPDCSGMYCELLPYIANGVGNYTSNTGRFPSTGTYDCLPGYVFSTAVTSRTCNRDGQWSNEHIACIGRPCLELTAPGVYSYSGDVLEYETGVVQYTNGGRYPSDSVYDCYPGYYMAFGQIAERSCFVDGTWGGGAHSCFATTGSHPSSLNYSYAECCPMPTGDGRRRYGNPACFQGDWSYDACCLAMPPPACIGIDCDIPMPQDAIQYGVITPPSNDGTYPSWQAVTCEPGFEFDDDATLALNESTAACSNKHLVALGLSGSYFCLVRECSIVAGQWLPDVQPTCGGIMCQDPAVPNNGSVSMPTNGGRFPSAVSYACAAGYDLIGPPERRCKTSGGWEAVSTMPGWRSMVPSCQGIRCDAVFYPPDGEVSASNGRRYPSVATYTCDAGFALTGENHRSCTTAGSWSGEEPWCRGCGLGCGVCWKLEPAVGVVNNCSAPQDCCEATCTLSCAPGWTGDTSVISCGHAGNWSGGNPSCMRDCVELPDPGPSQSVWTIVYTLNETNYTNGSYWVPFTNFSVPVPEAIDGPEPEPEPEPLGSWLDGSRPEPEPAGHLPFPWTGTPHGAQRYITCSPGYVALSDHSDETSTCVSGAFMPVSLRCVPACEMPALQDHVVSNCTNMVPNCTASSNCMETTKCDARCEDGYSGETIVSSCGLNAHTGAGYWSRGLDRAVCHKNCQPPVYDHTVEVVGDIVVEVWTNATNTTVDNVTTVQPAMSTWTAMVGSIFAEDSSDAANTTWVARVEDIDHGSHLQVFCGPGLLARNKTDRTAFVGGTDTLACDNGTLSDQTIECAEPSNCPGGTADIDGEAWTPCDICQPGFYSNGLAVFCSACEAGRYGRGARATSRGCEACAAGKYSHATARTSHRDCIACVTGTYSETAGNGAETDCVVCGAGKYSGTTGNDESSDCTDCGMGKYSESTGLTVESGCIACVSGKYSLLLGSNASANCESCTPVEHAEDSATYTCTSCNNTRTSGCTVAYWVFADLADRCEPCNNMSVRPSVERCLECADASADTCTQGVCAVGFHTYDSTANQTCTQCTDVSYAASDAGYTCTSAMNSRVSACTERYFVHAANSVSTSDRCELCSDMSLRPSVDRCLRCTDDTTESCIRGVCATGFHTYESSTQTCTRCTEVVNAAANATYTCTSAVNSRLSSCIVEHFVDVGLDAYVNGVHVGSDSADECTRCNIMRARRSVTHCLVCGDGEVDTCSEGACAVGFHTYASSTQTCTACTAVANAGVYAGYTCTTAGNSRVSECAAGFFVDAVPDADTADRCTPCNDMASVPSVVSCLVCADANVLTCMEAVCASGFHTYNLGIQCQPCTPVVNAYGDATYTCTSELDSLVSGCAPGYFVRAHQQAVGQWVAGYFVEAVLDEDTADRCELCSNMTSSPSVDSCLTCADDSTEECSAASCAAGHHSYDRRTQTCAGCNPGSYVDTVGSLAQNDCKQCQPGKYLPYAASFNVSDCIECELGQYASTGSVVCTDCEPGKYNAYDPARPCSMCAVGRYADSGATECIVCGSGRSDADMDPSTECIRCLPGTFAWLGKSGPDGCAPCVTGKYDNDFYLETSATTPCRFCTVGQFQALTGQVACDACAAGQYQDVGGRDECQNCSVGTYGLFNGSSSRTDCIDCAAGRFINATGSSNSSSCEACDYGTYAGNGSSYCVLCRAGYVDLDEDPSTGCVGCDPGSFSGAKVTVCQGCNPGWADVDADAASECERCQLGSYSGAFAIVCESCDAGRADVDIDTATQCTQCANGTYAPVGATQCVECASGFADLDMDAASECETCGAEVGLVSATGLTECPLVYCQRYHVQHARATGGILFRDLDERTWPDNDPYVLTCGPGYSHSRAVVLKAAERRCQANATWDDTPPACVPINCSMAPQCGTLLRTGCLDTINTCGACHTGYASILEEGDGNDQCGILALAFNASIDMVGPPPHLSEFIDAVEAAAANSCQPGAPVAVKVIGYVQTLRQTLSGLPGTPEDYMVPGPSTAWGQPARQVEEALKIAVAPEATVTVNDVFTVVDRRQLLEGESVRLEYSIVSPVDVSAAAAGNWSGAFLDALSETDGPLSVHNSTNQTYLTELGPLAVYQENELIASQAEVSTAITYVVTVRVTSAPASVIVLEQVSQVLQNVSTLTGYLKDNSNRSFSINRLGLLSAGLVHLGLAPPPPPHACGTFDIMCITRGIGSHYVILSAVGMGALWFLFGLCKSISDQAAAKHARKVHAVEYPGVHETEDIFNEKRRQTTALLKAMSERVDPAQVDSLFWRVGEDAIVDKFIEMTFEECTTFKRVWVDRGDKLPEIELVLQPLDDATIDLLIELLKKLKLDTRELHRPPHWWDAASKKHGYYVDLIYARLGGVDMLLHCMCASVLRSEGRIDDGIDTLASVACLSLVLRAALSATAAMYAAWYLHEVKVMAETHKHLTATLVTYHRTRRRSHHERIEDARARTRLGQSVATLTVAAKWKKKTAISQRPQSAPGVLPAGGIFHEYALRDTAPLSPIHDAADTEDHDTASEEGDDPDDPLRIADRLKGGQRPQSAGNVDVAVRTSQRTRPQSAAADAMMRTPAFETARRPQSAASLQLSRPQSAASMPRSRPGSAAPVVVSQYPPSIAERKVRPATASVGSSALAVVRAERPHTAGYLSPSKLMRRHNQQKHENQQKQLVPDSSSERPQSASAALVGLQAQLITFYDETPASQRGKSAGKRAQSAGSKRPQSSKTRLGKKAAEALIPHTQEPMVLHKRPVSAPLTLFHDAPLAAVREINTETGKMIRSLQTQAAETDRKQRSQKKRSQKLQDAADMGKLRRDHLHKVAEQQHGKVRPRKLEPIAEAVKAPGPVKLKRPQSAASVLMSVGAKNPAVELPAVDEGEEKDDEDDEAQESSDEEEAEHHLREDLQYLEKELYDHWVSFWKQHGLVGGCRRIGYAFACLLNPFALSAALGVYRKHEGITPLQLAVVSNVWVIMSDVPLACALIDYSLRREMLTVTSVFDGGGPSMESRVIAANEDDLPWVTMRVQWMERDVGWIIYATMACTAFSLCLHFGIRWLSCVRCCCGMFSCGGIVNYCKRKPKEVVANGQVHKDRAAAYLTAGTHKPLGGAGEGLDDYETEVDDVTARTLPAHKSVHSSRPQSARPLSGGKHHEVDTLLERPRSADLARNVVPAGAASSKLKQRVNLVLLANSATSRSKSAGPLLPALHTLRETSHGEDVGHVNHSVW